MRAILDIGTNSVLCLMGARRPDGTVLVEADLATVTRLGEGVAASQRLKPEAIERTLEALRNFASKAAARGAELTAVATAGVRLANNRADFLAAAQGVLGVPVRVLTGDEEALFSYRSVADEYPDASAALAVLDIGGGSTELILGHGRVLDTAWSLPIGSVRLTEAALRSASSFASPEAERPTPLTALRAAAKDGFAGLSVPPFVELHGVAGTVTSAGALLLRLETYDRTRVDGARFPADAVTALLERMASLTVAQRSRLPVLGPGRADVIVAGLAILEAALSACQATTLVVRDRGLRYALL